MIKKSFRLMLLAAFALSSVMFVSCNKWEDEINELDSKVAALEQTVATLKAAVDGGAVISSVSNTSEGVKFTLSNGQSYTVTNGVAGQDGKDGKPGSVVTIGENGNWFIDGVDQNVSAVGASTFVVDCGSYYELNVIEKVDGENAEIVKINLPKTKAITEISVVTIGSGNAINKAETVQMNYGKYLSDAKVTFNDVTYPRYSYLVAAGSSLTAIVNPMDADASVYQFSLVDSKGNAPYVISNVKANATDGALTPGTKAATANKGVWDMSVNFAEGVSHSATNAASRSAKAYALVAYTADGVVASPYDVKVNEYKVSSVMSNTSVNGQKKFSAMSRPVNKSINLMNTFTKGGTGVVANQTHKFYVDGQEVSDLTPYIVDCYFEIADKTVAEQYGLVLDGTTLTAEKPVDNVKINVYYLFVDGSIANGKTDYPAGTMNASFTYVAPTGSLSDVNWTISHKSSAAVVYVPLGDLQSQLVASTDKQLPSVAKVGNWYRANGYGLDDYRNAVEVNGDDYGYYGTKFAGNEDSWIADIEQTKLYYKKSNGTYTEATSETTIQTPLYVKFTFDYTEAFPGEYYITLGLKKFGSSVNNFEVPVKVTINAPEAPIYRYENYFSGDNAVAYGTAAGNGADVEFNLLNLFKTEDDSMRAGNLSFSETKVYKSNGDAYTKWLQAGTTTIKVPVYKYGTNVDNTVTVNATHEYTATLAPYGNEHIEATEYVFNLTVKSAIAEGSFTTTASKTIETSKGVTFGANEFNGTDVYGDKFYVASVYGYDAENGVYTNTAVANKDSRIAKVEVLAADDNATDYLTFTQFESKPGTAADSFTVTRKASVQQLVNDTTCKLKVRITDNWGVRSEAEVTVVLKKF